MRNDIDSAKCGDSAPTGAETKQDECSLSATVVAVVTLAALAVMGTSPPGQAPPTLRGEADAEEIRLEADQTASYTVEARMDWEMDDDTSESRLNIGGWFDDTDEAEVRAEVFADGELQQTDIPFREAGDALHFERSDIPDPECDENAGNGELRCSQSLRVEVTNHGPHEAEVGWTGHYIRQWPQGDEGEKVDGEIELEINLEEVDDSPSDDD